MESHLLQMRGLKRDIITYRMDYAMSHLLQMRGLKPILIYINHVVIVASFTDAWIETWHKRNPRDAYGRIFYRCVD